MLLDHIQHLLAALEGLRQGFSEGVFLEGIFPPQRVTFGVAVASRSLSALDVEFVIVEFRELTLGSGDSYLLGGDDLRDF